MSTRMAFTEDQFNLLVDSLHAPCETAMVVAASLVEPATTPNITAIGTTQVEKSITLLAQTVTAVAEDAYILRGPLALSISSSGWVPPFRAAAANDQVPIFLHTHPRGLPEFSIDDDEVDVVLAASARAFGSRYYAAIVLAGSPDDPKVSARLYDLGDDFNAPTPEFVVIDAVRVGGAGLRLFLPPPVAGEETSEEQSSAFDRQIRMLGAEGNRTLKRVRAAIIGGGGTGSAVAVQVARLGLGELVVVDDDTVTDTRSRHHGHRRRPAQGRRTRRPPGRYRSRHARRTDRQAPEPSGRDRRDRPR